jgi:hypothetical protein
MRIVSGEWVPFAIRNHVFVAIERGQQSRRGLGDTDGFAFVPQTIAVFSLRQPLGVGAERSPQSIKSGRFSGRRPNHICRIRQTATGNVTKLRNSEFSTRDFGWRRAYRTAATEDRKIKMPIDMFAIGYH